MTKAYLFAAAPIALLAACKGEVKVEPADADQILSDIHAVENAQLDAFNAHDLAGATAPYAPDAQFLAPGAPLMTGSDAIKAAFQPMIADPQASIAITQGPAWVSATGDLAVTSGTFTYTGSGADGGGTEAMTGAVQSVWKKDQNGAWKIVSDFNVALPPADAAEASAPAAMPSAPTPAGATGASPVATPPSPPVPGESLPPPDALGAA